MTPELLAVARRVVAEASPTTLARGADYQGRGLLSGLSAGDGWVCAVVRDARDYAVGWDESSTWCDCPHFTGGDTCKHLAALALTVGRAETPPGSPVASGDAPDDLATTLGRIDHDDLVAMLVQGCGGDPAVDRWVRLSLAEASGDLSALRAQVDDVLGHRRRFRDWRQSSDLAVELHPVVDALDRAAAGPHAASAVPVVRRAVERLSRTMLHADDSSGSLGGVLGRLLSAHAVACELVRPDEVAMARWLVKVLYGEADFVDVDVADYPASLGERGRAVLRREVVGRLPAEGTAVDGWSYPVFRARHVLGRLAVLERDPDGIVAYVGGDFPAVASWTSVARAMLEIDRSDLALEWGRRGLEEPASWQHHELADLVADLLARAGDDEASLAVRWRQLERAPDVTSYRRYVAAVREGSASDDRVARARALLAARSPAQLVEALVADGEHDQAWRLATGPGAPDIGSMTLQNLVSRRARTDPAEALPYMVAFVDDVLTKADRRNYRIAVSWLTQIRAAHAQLGTDDDFSVLLAEMREQHRRRPTFLDELRRAKL